MGVFLTIVASIVCMYFTINYLKKNLKLIEVKNKEVESQYTRAFNYAGTLLWFFCCAVFSIGLIVNNLIID
ncbi:MAG: hypothetical protein OCD01_11850 [Fibrobacterales bacterium]